MTVFHEPERRRFRVCFLNYQKQLPAVPIAEVPFHLRLPRGRKPTRVTVLPDGAALKFTHRGGVLRAAAKNLSVFAMVGVEYE